VSHHPPRPPAWPPNGIIQPDGDDGTWGWYCPTLPDWEHAVPRGYPDERTALRYLIAHLAGCQEQGAGKHLTPARRRLMELVRAGQPAGMRLVRGVAEDLIVLWAEVLPGDMVLLDDALVMVERVEVTDQPWGDGGTYPSVGVTVRLGYRRLVVSEQHGDRLTAVRRIT
jgi:hypothetical protein